MDLLQSIGKTPLIRLAKLTAGLDAEILVKVESRNPGGSIKDRAALRMIQGALERGTLKPNGTIVEPTSGNTGIGLAVVSTCMGFKLILTMPESMSDERKALLRGFGAELILTPAAKGMGGAVEEAQRLAATVEPAAQQMARFFRAAESGGALDPWLDRDFKGGLPAGAPAGVRSVPAY